MTVFSENLFVDQTPIVRMENEFLQIDIAASVGGRVVSLFNKSLGQQFLWHNPDLKLEKLDTGSEYDPNFYGTVDELLPNDIPETINGIDCPDHGELWTTSLDYRIDSQSLLLSGDLPIFGLRYEKRMSLRSDGPYLDCDYRIQNVSGERREMLWKLHAALNIAAGDHIVCPAQMAVVGDPEYSRWDTTEPFAWPEVCGERADIVPEKDGTMDFLYLYELTEGVMAWENAQRSMRFAYEFDLEVFPYAWLFASFGGFDGHYMAILEPCTAMPISVTEAAKLSQCLMLDADETVETRVSIFAGPRGD